MNDSGDRYTEYCSRVDERALRAVCLDKAIAFAPLLSPGGVIAVAAAFESYIVNRETPSSSDITDSVEAQS